MQSLAGIGGFGQHASKNGGCQVTLWFAIGLCASGRLRATPALRHRSPLVGEVQRGLTGAAGGQARQDLLDAIDRGLVP